VKFKTQFVRGKTILQLQHSTSEVETDIQCNNHGKTPVKCSNSMSENKLDFVPMDFRSCQ